MQSEKERFLSLKTFPARLNSEETGWLLGFAVHDVPILIGNGLLKPLGHPAANCVKFFALSAIEPLRTDLKWLARATDAVMEHWRGKNARKMEETSGQPG